MVDGEDREPLSEGPSHTRFLLGRIAEEAQRAQELEDPLEQAKALALLIQPYAGWALREAVWDCRGNDMKWSVIAPEVGLSQAVLSRQVKANGPVVTITPYYGLDSRNADGQTPLRLAAFSLEKRVIALAMTTTDERSPLLARLYIPVLAMGQAMAANQAEPLLKTVKEVLRQADGLDSAAAGTEQEQAVLDSVGELGTAFERYQGTIRVAAELKQTTESQKGE
ncbi:hypothetical protein [Kitasatospora sp. NBC_01302]|uniref:hypothetical protein n=1 Tax=Kitasatospora sp. NBC_01302 TaxID=2903575 RepID=UPI002E0D1F68|nr:hypothetical protein OG294_40210 [Kitasatospora sp. NBC_01302]